MQTLKPWLNSDYIRKAHFDGSGNFTLMFADGGQRSYHIDECSAEQLNDIETHLKSHGVQVLK
jgi:hypothetical protein